jgi:murein DD-endopeptidase MepM/ murein hydrolase activator NlpD
MTTTENIQGLANGHIIRRGQSPLMIVRDGIEAIAVYRGSRIIWDGTRPVIVGIPTAQATAHMPAPTTITGASAAIPPMMAAASMPEPTAIVDARVVISAATATASMPAPSTVIPADTHVPVMSATASMPTPGVLITDTAIGQAPTMYATASMPAPTAVVNAGVTIPPMTATAFMPAPTGGIQTNIVIPPMTATATMPAPTPATGTTTVIPPALASAFMLPPTVVAGANIVIPPMTATATMPAPTMTTTVAISDTLNRSDGPLGPDWVTIGQAPVISAQRAQGGTTGASNSTTAYAARHVTPLTQADQKVTAWVAKPAGTQAYAQGGGGFLRSTADGQNRAEVYATISGTTHTIGIKSYVGGTGTVRASSTAYKLDMLPVSGQLRLCPSGLVLRAVGNVYTVWLNNSPTTISWTDVGNIVSQANRHWGFVTYTTESIAGAATYSMAIARIDAEDYFPTTPVWETYEWMQPGWGTKTNGWGYYTGSSTTFHNGIDLTTGGTTGRPIYAPADGIVLLAGGPSVVGSAYGNGASIWHEGDICTDYAHMVNPPPLVAGQVVTRGQVIGNVGSTGNSSEPHLHFAVRRGSYPFNGSAGAGTDDKWLMDTQFPYEDPEAFLRQVGVTINWAVNPG